MAMIVARLVVARLGIPGVVACLAYLIMEPTTHSSPVVGARSRMGPFPACSGFRQLSPVSIAPWINAMVTAWARCNLTGAFAN